MLVSNILLFGNVHSCLQQFFIQLIDEHFIHVLKILWAFDEINVFLTCYGKLSLTYLQLNASRNRSYKDDRRGRNSGIHVNELTYDGQSAMPGQPISKKAIDAIHRSKVWLFAQLPCEQKYRFPLSILIWLGTSHAYGSVLFQTYRFCTNWKLF